jgi:two-component system phosphate regulon response regulator PhoB
MIEVTARQPGSMARVLLVEDELDIQDLMALHLRRAGHDVLAVGDGDEALRVLASEGPFDLVVLDWMLPGATGLEVTRSIRASSEGGAWLPILMVTARMEAADIVAGLEAGADDYVTKPFEIPVLLARVRALLRRAELLRARGGEAGSFLTTTPEPVIDSGSLRIDPGAHEVRCDGTLILLTPSEFKLLLALARSQGKVLTRDQLIAAVQGSGVTVVDRAVDTHVFGLRKKLGLCSERIETVRGVGYRFRSE